MNKIFAALALAALLLAPSGALAAEVVQGKCLELNAAAQTLTVEEYDINFSQDHPYGRSTGVTATFDISTAKIGLAPEPGDILRIAYDLGGSGKIALKVMNVTKQGARE
ncbi:hypothetical protein [Desulfocurvus sp. DL9XJH121]